MDFETETLLVQPIAFPANLSGTQCAAAENLSPSMGAKNPTAVAVHMSVRRLTVEECEILQGFPRGYSQIPWRNKPASECPDGPRYKALGNSWATPNVAWIGKRIAKELA
jgi:DNA (cytosine-5)-methyltransferase 1